MIVEVRFDQGLLFPQAVSCIFINGKPFRLLRANWNQFKFVGPRLGSIAFITLPNDACASFPQKVSVNGRRYVRRCEGFYTPAAASEAEIGQFFNHIASTYEQCIDLKLNRLVNERMLTEAIKYGATHDLSTIDVLDYGCGTGLSYEQLGHLRKHDVTVKLQGCDISEKMIHLARERGFHDTHVCFYAKTIYSSAQFDVVFCSFVAHYFADARPFLEMIRVLKPGGLLICNLTHVDKEQEHFYRGSLTSEAGNLTMRRSCWKVITSKERMIPVIRVRRRRGQVKAQTKGRGSRCRSIELWSDSPEYRDQV